jgi:hypothetical protein
MWEKLRMRRPEQALEMFFVGILAAVFGYAPADAGFSTGRPGGEFA